MEFPILAMEVRAILRRRLTFLFAFLLYATLACSMVVLFRNYASFVEDRMAREVVGRQLFRGILSFGYLGLGFHAALLASGTLAGERERKTAELLRACPVPARSILFQKIFTPVAVEWLLFLGMLPVVSMAFLFGGLALWEFIQNLISLGFWVNTAIMMGTAFSARSRSTARAIAWTMGSAFLLVYVIPALLSLSRMGTPSPVGFIPWFLSPVCLLSPLAPLMIPNLSLLEGLLAADLVALFPRCPAAACWIAHSLLQAALFCVAIRWWRRKAEGGRSSRRTRSSLWGVRDRPPFKSGSRVFRELEGRVVFKRGRRFLRRIVTVGFLLIGVVLILANGSNWCMTMCGWVTAAGFSVGAGLCVTALQRERDRGSVVLLLSSPHEDRKVFFGKWVYYLNLTYGILLCGWALPISAIAFLLLFQGLPVESDKILEPLVWLLNTAAFVPMATLAAMYGGMWSKRGLTPVLVFSFFLLAIGAQGFWFVAGLVSSGRSPADAWAYLLFYQCLPIGLWGGASYLLLSGRKEILMGPQWWESVRPALGIGLSALIVWNAFVGMNNLEKVQPYRNLPFTNQQLLNEARWLLIPLCAAFLFWYWLATRSRWWWVKHLLK